MASKRESLFEWYAEDHLRLFPNSKQGFVCPICLKCFAWRENLAEVVAIEHIVPDALGGKLTTLTCRQCNNTAGTKLERHLVQRVELEARKKHIQAVVESCGIKFRGEFHLPASPDDALKLFGSPKQSHPREIEEFVRLLSAEEWDGQELHLDLKLGYSPLRSAAALVRSAYLLMFRLFGYRYVYDKSAEAIRESITEPLTETNVLKGISWRVPFRPPTETGISIVTNPRELRSFMVFLTLDKDQDHVSTIALPPPNAGMEFFDLLNEVENPRRCTMSSWLPGDSEEFMPLDDLWQDVIRQDASEPIALKDD